MRFVWDPRKGAVNLKKHGVSFLEATSVFGDPLAVTGADPDHSDGEERWITLGLSDQQRLILVAHIDASDSIRIISARRATRIERCLYEEG